MKKMDKKKLHNHFWQTFVLSIRARDSDVGQIKNKTIYMMTDLILT